MADTTTRAPIINKPTSAHDMVVKRHIMVSIHIAAIMKPRLFRAQTNACSTVSLKNAHTSQHMGIITIEIHQRVSKNLANPVSPSLINSPIILNMGIKTRPMSELWLKNKTEIEHKMSDI